VVAGLGDLTNKASGPPLAEDLGKPPLRYRILDRQNPISGCAFGDRGVAVSNSWDAEAAHAIWSSLISGGSVAANALTDDITTNTTRIALVLRIVPSFKQPGRSPSYHSAGV
jgi:hypothetical protein